MWFSELAEDQLSFNAAVRVLCDYALVEADAASKDNSVESQGYSMHSCVHAWTKHVVNERWDDGMAGLALRCVGLHVPNTNAPQYWVTQQRLLRHANRCHGCMDVVLAGREDDITMIDAVHGLGILYRYQGKLDKAEEMYARALQGREKALGRDHKSTLTTVNNLGNLYAAQGKLDEAEEMYERALQGREKALGPDHTSTLGTVNNLGVLYAGQGKRDKAEEMYQWALQGYEKRFGFDHPRCRSLRRALATLQDRVVTQSLGTRI